MARTYKGRSKCLRCGDNFRTRNPESRLCCDCKIDNRRRSNYIGSIGERARPNLKNVFKSFKLLDEHSGGEIAFEFVGSTIRIIEICKDY